MFRIEKIGIMQGRLVPPADGRIQCFPRGSWEAEFPNAAAAGLDSIEWIYDTWGLGANPIETEEGAGAIASAAAAHRVAVRSICADYFMDFAFVRATETEFSERLAHLEWLIGQAGRIGAGRIVLPFVDQSAIRDEADRHAVREALRRVLPSAEPSGVELHLETSLPPEEFARLLACVAHPLVKVNYDSGNSSSLGYKPSEEFAAYGERVGSVHIKDRVLHGSTVPLGQGDADLASVFACLNECNYTGDVILQVARGASGDEVEWARQNRAFVERHLN